jgi:predicted sulfurtransferase
MENYEYIEPAELKELLHDESVKVIDVRDDDFNADGM